MLLLVTLSLIGAWFLPLWQILMWAPQYPEGLSMRIWLEDISGDVRIINAVNHYIGMRTIEKEMFPEFLYMKYIVAGVMIVGLVGALSNRRWGLLAFLTTLVLVGLAALYDFYQWGYDYGHNLDPEAAIKVPGLSYQPPLIGSKQLLNFLAYSGPDAGGWIFITAGLVCIGCLLAEVFSFPGRVKSIPLQPA